MPIHMRKLLGYPELRRTWTGEPSRGEFARPRFFKLAISATYLATETRACVAKQARELRTKPKLRRFATAIEAKFYPYVVLRGVTFEKKAEIRRSNPREFRSPGVHP